MTSLTPEMKSFVVNEKKKDLPISNRRLESKIRKEFGTSPSYKTIGNFVNSYEFRMTSQDIPKPSQNIPNNFTRKSPMDIQKPNLENKNKRMLIQQQVEKRTRLTIDKLLKALEKNPDHPHASYLYERIQPPKYRSRTEWMKLFEFIEDVKI